MQRIGESRWRPLELCYWPEQGALPAKGKEYPGLGYKRLRDKPPKAQEQQPAVSSLSNGSVTIEWLQPAPATSGGNSLSFKVCDVLLGLWQAVVL
ncbi:hypothetical protein HaLaN_23754 [Haematococcus lacustris]|uniref:Uncharacterized protein n=1 Tax=Haematococcus lacustris TaxID=44745 RepID=A0A699ZSV3_HAELA|nr:hypothetical protein HaLaN_23754 [Haematococcus lacustris]